MFLSWFLLSSAPAYPAEIHYLGIIPFYAPEKIWNLYLPFVEHLSRTSGIRWDLRLYHNHDSMIDGLCSGEIAVALLGPVPFGRAHERCSARPILVALGSDGRPEYSSVIITGDPAVRSLQNVRGKKFGFFEGSTAAFVLPRKMLEDEGITMDMIYPVFFPGQDRILEALLKRDITAAGVKETLYGKFRDAQITVLKTSPPVPNFVFCSSPSLDPAAEQAFVKTLLDIRPLTDPRDRATAQRWDDEVKHGFVLPPKNYIEDARRLSDLFRTYRK